MLSRFFARLVAASPWLKRILWRRWYQILAGRYRQTDWTFMNYGYAEIDPEAKPLCLEAADEPDRCSIQLYHHVASAVDLRGKTVLEVGSGRGGGSSYVARYLKPARMVGVDYSPNAVDLSNRIHQVPGLSFVQGDAEALPFEDAAFDVVLNVESSHCYASMEAFLAEVGRVLKPGGCFLWADLRPGAAVEATRRQLAGFGADVVAERRISPNVVRALEAVHDRKMALIQAHVPRLLRGAFGDFAGVRGSRVWHALQSGEVEYRSGVYQKRAAP